MAILYATFSFLHHKKLPILLIESAIYYSLPSRRNLEGAHPTLHIFSVESDGCRYNPNQVRIPNQGHLGVAHFHLHPLDHRASLNKVE